MCLEIAISLTAVLVGGYLLDGFQGLSFDTSVFNRVAVFPIIFSFSLCGVGLYSSRQPTEFNGIVRRFLVAILLAGFIFALLYTIVPSLSVNLTRFLIFAFLSLFGLALIRISFYRFFDNTHKKRRVLILGCGRKAAYVNSLNNSANQRGFELIGFVPSPCETNNLTTDIERKKLLHIGKPLREFAYENQVNELVIAMDDRRGQFPILELMDCKMAGVSVIDVMDLLERESGKINLDLLNPGWIIHASGFEKYFFSDFLKRCFDIVCSVVLLIVSLPFSIAAMLVIGLECGFREPIFYRQRRVGKDNVEFDILKFRTMCVDAERDGKAQWAKQQDSRITRAGQILRNYRIDEIPQLVNVFKGDMSLVGPRPERPDIIQKLVKVNGYYNERHRVKPGLTGWAQLRFPYGASVADSMEKLQYDLYYLKNYSLLFDFYILIQTIEVVLFKRGSR